MIPHGMRQVYCVDVSFHCFNHEGKVEGVVSPILHSIVHEDLFMGLDVASSA